MKVKVRPQMDCSVGGDLRKLYALHAPEFPRAVASGSLSHFSQSFSEGGLCTVHCRKSV